MSDLTSSITNLVSKTDALIDTFDKKKAEIDAAVQSAIAAVPEHVRTVYLDQLKGDDKADGKTTGKPVKTLDRALELGGDGRTVYIRLLSDYQFDKRRAYLKANQTIFFEGWDTKKKVTLIAAPIEETSVDYGTYQWEVSGFYQSTIGHNIVVLKNIEICFPTKPPAGTFPNSAYSAFIGGHATVGGTELSVEMYGCDLIYPADGCGTLVGGGIRPLNLIVKASTYTAAAMAGKWVNGVAAGTAVPISSKNWIQTNLATL